MIKKDITQIVNSTGNNLERNATATFGNAVEDFTKGRLSRALPSAGATQQSEIRSAPSTWDASSYAAVLAGATEFRPKLKFLFKVQFFFEPKIVESFPDLAKNDFTFMIKSVDRPKVDFEYEDDVNEYNYRTKVLKKIRHRELTLTFMDDVGNNVFDFFRSLMMIYSPVTRGALLRDNDYSALPNGRSFEVGSGMAFSGLNSIQETGGNQIDVAHRAMVDTYAGNAITLIRVKQIFLDPTNMVNKDKAISSNYYDFLNPRLVSFDLDDLNHESSDPNLLTMQFDYDWLEMTKNTGIQSLSDGLGPVYSGAIVAGKANDGGASGVPPDILLGRSTGFVGSPVSERGGANPFAGALSNVLGRGAQSITSNLVDKAVKGITSAGGLSRNPFGRAVASGLSNALGGVGAQVGGLVNSSIRDATSGLVSTISSSASTGAARLSGRLFSDNATVGPDRVKSQVKSQQPLALPQGDEGG
jgi:hypothetical protein